MEEAQCFGHSDPDAWFPESSKHLDERQLIVRRGVEALSVCSYCPVKRECLELGLLNANINSGIFGGTLPYERKEAIGWKAHSQTKSSDGWSPSALSISLSGTKVG